MVHFRYRISFLTFLLFIGLAGSMSLAQEGITVRPAYGFKTGDVFSVIREATATGELRSKTEAPEGSREETVPAVFRSLTVQRYTVLSSQPTAGYEMLEEPVLAALTIRIGTGNLELRWEPGQFLVQGVPLWENRSATETLRIPPLSIPMKIRMSPQGQIAPRLREENLEDSPPYPRVDQFRRLETLIRDSLGHSQVSFPIFPGGTMVSGETWDRNLDATLTGGVSDRVLQKIQYRLEDSFPGSPNHLRVLCTYTIQAAEASLLHVEERLLPLRVPPPPAPTPTPHRHTRFQIRTDPSLGSGQGLRESSDGTYLFDLENGRPLRADFGGTKEMAVSSSHYRGRIEQQVRILFRGTTQSSIRYRYE